MFPSHKNISVPDARWMFAGHWVICGNSSHFGRTSLWTNCASDAIQPNCGHTSVVTACKQWQSWWPAIHVSWFCSSAGGMRKCNTFKLRSALAFFALGGSSRCFTSTSTVMKIWQTERTALKSITTAWNIKKARFFSKQTSRISTYPALSCVGCIKHFRCLRQSFLLC